MRNQVFLAVLDRSLGEIFMEQSRLFRFNAIFGREKVKCYCLSERCKKWHFEFVVLIVNPDESKNIFLLVLTGPRNAQGQFHAGIRFNATIMFIPSLFSILHLRLKWASHFISKNNILKISESFLTYRRPICRARHFSDRDEVFRIGLKRCKNKSLTRDLRHYDKYIFTCFSATKKALVAILELVRCHVRCHRNCRAWQNGRLRLLFWSSASELTTRTPWKSFPTICQWYQLNNIGFPWNT